MNLSDKLGSIGYNRAILATERARMADAIGNSILFILIPLYVAKIPEEFVHFPTPVLVGILISVFGPLISGLLANFFFELPFLVIGIVTGAGAWVVYKYLPETVKKQEA